MYVAISQKVKRDLPTYSGYAVTYHIVWKSKDLHENDNHIFHLTHALSLQQALPKESQLNALVTLQ